VSEALSMGRVGCVYVITTTSIAHPLSDKPTVPLGRIELLYPFEDKALIVASDNYTALSIPN
jgi:hypothetical protein